MTKDEYLEWFEAALEDWYAEEEISPTEEDEYEYELDHSVCTYGEPPSEEDEMNYGHVEYMSYICLHCGHFVRNCGCV